MTSSAESSSTNTSSSRVFSKKYNLHRLVYLEAFGEIRNAIAREKQLKGWLRSKKIALIETDNPQWNDLAEGSFKLPKTTNEQWKTAKASNTKTLSS